MSSPVRRHVPAGAASVLGSRLGLIQITAAGALWGTTGVFVQFVRETTGLSPVSIGFYRLVVAAAVLLLLAARRLGSLWASLRSAPAPLVLIGVGLGAYQALYFVAVATAGVSVATVVSLGLAPVLTAGWEAARARRPPHASTLASLVAGISGLIMIIVSTMQPSTAAPRPLLGLLAAIGSGVGYASTTVLSRHVAQQVAARELTAVSATVGALALAPLAVVDGIGVPADVLPVSMLLYLGVITTAVAYALFYAGLRTTTGSAAAVLTLVEPLAAALLAVAVLDEAPGLPAVAGGVLLLSAVATLYLRVPSAPAAVRAGR